MHSPKSRCIFVPTKTDNEKQTQQGGRPEDIANATTATSPERLEAGQTQFESESEAVEVATKPQSYVKRGADVGALDVLGDSPKQ